MATLLKIFITFIVLTSSGCQLLTDWEASFNNPAEDTGIDGVQVATQLEQSYQILQLSNLYGSKTLQEQKLICEQLKSKYEVKKSWLTAWLIAYSVNNNFNCVNIKGTLALLKSIQQLQGVSSPLYQLNSNQIQILKKLSYLQTKNWNFRHKNSVLKKEITEAEVQLQEVISKIQALKVIETTINQKTQ